MFCRLIFYWNCKFGSCRSWIWQNTIFVVRSSFSMTTVHGSIIIYLVHITVNMLSIGVWTTRFQMCNIKMENSYITFSVLVVWLHMNCKILGCHTRQTVKQLFHAGKHAIYHCGNLVRLWLASETRDYHWIATKCTNLVVTKQFMAKVFSKYVKCFDPFLRWHVDRSSVIYVICRQLGITCSNYISNYTTCN